MTTPLTAPILSYTAPFGSARRQLAAHAAAAELAPLDEESAAAAAVNAWAAAGYKLDRPEEVEAARALRERNLDALRRMWELDTAAGPTLPALQRQAYAMELVERLAGVDGRGRARRCLARRCLCGAAALLFSVLTLVGAGFLIWDAAIKVRSPTYPSDRAPALSCPHPPSQHPAAYPRYTPHTLPNPYPLHPHRRTPCGLR